MAIPPTYSDDWQGYYLQLAASANAAQQTWINARLSEQWDRHDSGFWGSDRTNAVLLYVGHLWVLEMQSTNTGGAPTGQLSAITGDGNQGGYDRSFRATAKQAKSGSDEAWFALTTYGQQYLALRQSHWAGPRVTGGP